MKKTNLMKKLTILLNRKSNFFNKSLYSGWLIRRRSFSFVFNSSSSVVSKWQNEKIRPVHWQQRFFSLRHLKIATKSIRFEWSLKKRLTLFLFWFRRFCCCLILNSGCFSEIHICWCRNKDKWNWSEMKTFPKRCSSMIIEDYIVFERRMEEFHHEDSRLSSRIEEHKIQSISLLCHLHWSCDCTIFSSVFSIAWKRQKTIDIPLPLSSLSLPVLLKGLHLWKFV